MLKHFALIRFTLIRPLFERAFVLLLLVATCTGLAAARPDNWLEVRTPHFVVLTNSSEKQGRRIADQFERMRAFFHKRFPTAHVDAASPIVVIAVRDKKDFDALEPEAYLAKGQLNLAGYFLRTEEKNYILLRLDVEGDHPYATVYHEYTHFITGRAQEWMPLWLTEGLAEFYQNTEIKEKEVGLGQPSAENILLLRQSRMLPLATLLTVDHESPYYHEENKGSIFYAQSWALTHYLEITDRRENTQRLSKYAALVSNKVDSVSAATQAFGDLKLLEKKLDRYIEQGSFYYFRAPGATEVDDSAFKVRPFSTIEIDALRADFLACIDRVKDSRALLERVLQQDPNNLSAQETMGYLAFREGKLKEADKWYAQAVKLDSQSYLAHYYYAAISMSEGLPDERRAQIESSLRACIKLNPAFAPAFDQLARFYAMQRKNLEEARMLNLKAITLEPGNSGFRQNAANLLMLTNRPTDAVTVLKEALRLATTPTEIAAIQSQLDSVQRYQSERERYEKQYADSRQPASSTAIEISETTDAPNADSPSTEAAVAEPSAPEHHGPRHIVRGTLKDVQCTSPATMRLRLESPAAPTNSLQLHSTNFYKIEYTALNFTPSAELNPCRDLNNMKAKVTYYEGSSPTEGQIIAIEMTK